MIEYFKNYIETSKYGVAGLIVDIIIAVMIIAFIIVVLAKKIKTPYVIGGSVAFLAILIMGILLDLVFAIYIAWGILAFLIISLIVIVIPDIKIENSKKRSDKLGKQFLSDEDTKEELIETLMKVAGHFSSRRVGAIITIEKENTLNSYIEKAIQLEALVTFELLDTIFHRNTALHDGAVIIRGNKIICASAFYPSSDKSDIPQQYGSRHRAAIGISEVSDAFTIVVSEETGQIATTIGGTISGNVSLDSLKVSLNQHIIVRTGE